MTQITLYTEKSDAILYWTGRFGWLTIPMLAELVYAQQSQKDALTRRTLNRLLAEKLVTLSPLNHIRLVTLTPKGIRRVAEQFNVTVYPDSKRFGNPIHRAVENWRLIDAITDGVDVFTEHEIYTRSAPIHTFAQKMPDGVIDMGGNQLVWLEAENAFKSKKERQRIASFCQKHLNGDSFTPIAPDTFLARVEFVSTNRPVLKLLLEDIIFQHTMGNMDETQLSLISFSVIALNKQLRVTERTETLNLWYDWIVPRLE